ncbi:LEAF RUST 10 DISEASE-RESISTANCE LOCUS RECEPTOR-LIKE PROTEIN KINASE-like 1.1 [Camellia lanceoleosa]|uniref:LEAF RUST 10 DISEASE-RESISTANCE LOCUS RECEPTOR-LIKE PROTEIN KINASE-like 1.1 n=1 Tax=Camellia lanceoleosa TaxID=1840588 RepID=A0ACC0I9E8_9ERIC|nr:LEAF RUST 10 DISEASE-RESISTANCE LOCUS RECEPTOR-LIKE PROTEIN KINASE-like 1.1 [Camellia lanceoleosa]
MVVDKYLCILSKSISVLYAMVVCFRLLNWVFRMGFPSIFSFFVVSHLVIVHSTWQDDMHYQHGCPQSFNCGKLGPIKFPFSNDSTYSQCGLCTVNCSEPVPKLHFWLMEERYEVKEFLNDEAVNVSDKLISSNSCDIFSNLLLPPPTPSISYTISPNLTLFKCPTNSSSKPQLQTEVYNFTNCPGYTVYYTDPNQHTPTPANLSPDCVVIQLPMLPSIRNQNVSDLFSLLASEFTIGLHVSKECNECRHNGGQCHGHREFHCIKDEVIAGRSHLKVVLATVIPGVILLLGLLAIRYRKKLNYVSSVVPSINTSSDPSSKPDLEGGSVYFGVPVFSYTELEEATNNFDPSKELGDGGFGTVYYGKLQDGREVAVKRLYEHNYKRVTQFMNEIEILTRLRHRNLVTLYGCTSRLSRELLLVYEYIPNGTVADHIHGDRANDRPLVWSIRMSIAIETASALTYLHASDIIHRDVKTNNILLDNNFCVKVADFGLSRLFPNDVTHVSTAPQGTPGYVDPEYHQCYQLTDKSDVYSFGVVLIELISSMTAVDISRHRHEINLANLAINRIQHRAFNELIDPSLGFESDSSIERMTTMVAEVAFQCLQLEKEMRPTMEEVLRALKEIQDSKDEDTGDVIENAEVLTSTRPPPSPEGDNIVLLKNGKELPSPDAVTDRWVSSSSTSISSG